MKVSFECSLPEKYSAIKLPSKLPPPREPAGIAGLPLLGFLEQTVADTLIVSLSALGNLKPKFPHMSASRAAIVYLALYLKGALSDALRVLSGSTRAAPDATGRMTSESGSSNDDCDCIVTRTGRARVTR